MRGAPAVARRLGGSIAIFIVQVCRTCKPSLHEGYVQQESYRDASDGSTAPHSSGPNQRKHHQYMSARLAFSTYLQLLI